MNCGKGSGSFLRGKKNGAMTKRQQGVQPRQESGASRSFVGKNAFKESAGTRNSAIAYASGFA